MDQETSSILIRRVPTDLHMQLKVLAALQHRTMQSMMIEAFREKVQKHHKELTEALGLLEN